MERSELSKKFIESLNTLIDEKYGNKYGKYVRFREDFADYIDDKDGKLVSNLKKWNSGAIPEVSTLYSIASFFDVSIDYLLGNAERKESYGTQYIMEQTGLSESNIRILADRNKRNKDIYIQPLNKILGMEAFTYALYYLSKLPELYKNEVVLNHKIRNRDEQLLEEHEKSGNDGAANYYDTEQLDHQYKENEDKIIYHEYHIEKYFRHIIEDYPNTSDK